MIESSGLIMKLSVLFDKYKNRLVNISIRVSTLLIRFVFIFTLAKLVDVEIVALYGLILATISFAVMLLGADFYIYAQREMLQRDKLEWYWVISQQIYAQAGLCILFLPLVFLLFIFKILSWEVLVLFFLLLIFEHISQEINRILVAMHQQIQASIILLIRKALWMLPVMFFIHSNNDFAKIDFILWAWVAGCFLSIIIGIKNIKANITFPSLPAVDFIWIKSGFKLAGMLLISTLCIKGLTTFDKYAIEILGNLELLGVYVLYMTIVFGTFSFLEPAVYSFLYPTLLSSYHKKDHNLFNKTFKELIYSTIFIGTLLSLFIYLFTPFLLNWIDKEEYINSLNILHTLIIVGFISNLGYIPHYYLYSANAYNWIIYPRIFSLIIFFVTIYFIERENILETVSYALLAAYLSILLIKMLGYFKIKYEGGNTNAI
jgi:O-antigen/teichoic acid export membrane protein